jgi:hypothetical protein
MKKSWLSQLENNFKMRSKKMKQIHVKSKEDQENSSNSNNRGQGSVREVNVNGVETAGEVDQFLTVNENVPLGSGTGTETKTEIETENPPSPPRHQEQTLPQQQQHSSSLGGSSSSSVGSSSASVISMMLDKEQKRGESLLTQFQRCDVTECGPGAPSGHIPRELKKTMPESVNIDRSSASLPFLFTTNTHSYLSFPKKKSSNSEEGVAWDSSPLTNKSHSTSGTPRGGSRRGLGSASSSASNSSRRGGDTGGGSGGNGNEMSLREAMRSYVFVTQVLLPTLPSIQRGERGGAEAADALSESAEAMVPVKVRGAASELQRLWRQHSEALRVVSTDLHLTDLRELAHLPLSPFVSLIFEYLHCLILGRPSSPSSPPLQLLSCGSPSPRHSNRKSKISTTAVAVGEASDEKDVRRVLLKESSSLLALLQQIDLAVIPLQNISLASALFQKQITALSGETVARLSRPFTKLVK